MFLDYTGVRLNSDKAAGKKIDMILELTDTKQKYEVGVENGALHYTELSTHSSRRRDGVAIRRRAVANPDVTLTTTRENFNDVMMGQTTVNQLVADGKATMGGSNPSRFPEFTSWLDKFDFWFNIVSPAALVANGTVTSTTGASQMTTGTIKPTGAPSQGQKIAVKIIGSLLAAAVAVWTFI